MTADTFMIVHRLRCEYKENPLGIDVLHPRLSWQLDSSRRGAMQSAYQIQVSSHQDQWEDRAGLLWDSGRVMSDACIHIPYEGVLRTGQRYYWRVRAWDEAADITSWSEVAWWEMGLLSSDDWLAKWIEPGWNEDAQTEQPSPYMRKTFTLNGRVKSARAYITAHGLYELSFNGRLASEEIFTPGFTTYEKRLQYQTYDVTSLLRERENAIGVILGDGWWRGKIGAMSVRNAYGTRLAVLAQIHILYEEDTEQWVLTDGTWKAATGPILSSDMKDGEIYDARLEMPGWDTASFDDSAWKGVLVQDYGKANLVAPSGVPVRRHEEIRPVKILHTPNGETVVDMGQNFAGRVRLKVRAPAGTTIMMRHGETLDKDGNFTMSNLTMPAVSGGQELLQQVTYTAKGADEGAGEEVYEPHFTFHGFRYMRVQGFPGEPTPDNFTGIAIYSDMPSTGSFATLDPAINQLYSNIVWSMKSNFLDIPTDCPQRERAGWTGDAQVFARTGSTIMDTSAFFTKWLRDLAAEQHANGMVTNLVPNAFRSGNNMAARIEGSAGWGDAAVIIPWTLYLCFGDRRILEQQYVSMKAWVDYEARHAAKTHRARWLEPSYWLDKERRKRQRYIWDTKYHWGEWLEPGTSTTRQSLGIVARMVFGDPPVATAYLAYSSGLMARTAKLLGNAKDAARYEELHERVKAAYVAEFVRPDGRMKPDKQASYARALALDLLPEALRPLAAQRLADLVRQNGNHIGTGFLSTPFLCPALTRYGHLDTAYDLLYQTSVPSWLYPISKGATSIWETWDAIRPDGTVGALSSLNHYSYGAVAGWLYQMVAGIDLDPDCPGYKHVVIQPNPGGSLRSARAFLETLYGRVESSWQISSGHMRLEVVIPANTRATVRLPRALRHQVTEGGVPLTEAAGLSSPRQERESVVFEAVSGKYVFEYPTR